MNLKHPIIINDEGSLVRDSKFIIVKGRSAGKTTVLAALETYLLNLKKK